MDPKPAHQSRSARTLERILEACDRLLADRDLDALTMKDIAEEAGVSVGNLYNRFADRDALLAHLVERRQSSLLERLEGRLAETERPAALRERLAGFATLFQEEIRPARPLLVGLLHRTRPEPVLGAAPRNDALVDVGVDWLIRDDPDLAGEAMRDRCRFVVASIAFQLQWDLLYGTATRLFGPSLVERIAEQALSALRPEETGS
jgi:AcrR family transcriptional regulator